MLYSLSTDVHSEVKSYNNRLETDLLGLCINRVIELFSPSIKILSEKVSQPVSRQNHPSVSNPARTDNVSRRKHGSRCDHRAIHSPALRNPNPSPVAVSNLRRNLEALFSPRIKVGVRKFGELTPLKLLAVSERR